MKETAHVAHSQLEGGPPPRPSVVIAVAHPDDETFGSGGLTALLSNRGVPVHVIIATDGAAGEIADPALDTPGNRARLAEIRRAEAEAAAQVLGAAGLHFLDHPDGALDSVALDDLAAEIGAVIEAVRPAVVITFGPEGIYGHPDHIAVSKAASRAFGEAEAEVGARGGEAGPLRLFYQVLTAADAKALNENRGPVVLAGEAHPFVGYQENEITTQVDISAVAERKFKALAAHRSQTGGQMEEIAAWLKSRLLVEHYLLARRHTADAPGLGTDILAGIDPGAGPGEAPGVASLPPRRRPGYPSPS